MGCMISSKQTAENGIGVCHDSALLNDGWIEHTWHILEGYWLVRGSHPRQQKWNKSPRAWETLALSTDRSFLGGWKGRKIRSPTVLVLVGDGYTRQCGFPTIPDEKQHAQTALLLSMSLSESNCKNGICQRSVTFHHTGIMWMWIFRKWIHVNYSFVLYSSKLI